MRKFAIVAFATVLCGGLNMSVASATTTPATGSLSCGVSGTMTLKPGIPATAQTPTTKWTMGKIHKATLDTCNNAGVTGGKASITGGVVIVNARLNPGASCDTLLSSLTSVNKIVVGVKLTNTTTTTTIDPITLLPITSDTTRTVAVVKVKDAVVSQSGNGVHLTGTIQQSASGKKPFGGEILDAQLNVDNSADTSACVSGETPLDHVDFSTAGGSSIQIHP